MPESNGRTTLASASNSNYQGFPFECAISEARVGSCFIEFVINQHVLNWKNSVISKLIDWCFSRVQVMMVEAR